MLTTINPTFANPVALILAIILAIALTTPTPAQQVRPAAVHDTALLSSNPAHLEANAADEAAPLNRRAITISGIVQRLDGTPIENAVIISSAGGKAISNPDGSFTLEVDVPESAESLDVTAVATIDSVNYTAIRLVELSPGDRRRDISAMPLSANGDCKPEWFPTFGGEGGVNNLIRALTVFDDGAGPALYAGGRFTTAWGIGHPAGPADTSRLTGDGASVSVDRPLRERVLPIAWNWSPISALFGTAQSEPMITFAWQGTLQHDQITVRARLSTEGTARLAYSTDPNMSNPGFTSEVQSAGDNIATIELSGLVPQTRYYWAVEVWDGIDWVRDEQFSGRFMTPGIGQYSFQIATASCAGNSGADFVLPGLPKTSNAPTFTMIEEKDPLFFLHMGDMHYRDIGTNDVALFRQAFRDTLANARQNSLYRNVPLAYIFDDHDFGPNDAHGFGPQVPAALTTYREYVPHYPFGLEGDPDDTPVCQSFSIGRVRFILLDVRAERHWKTFMPIEDKSMLGPEQKAWLKDELLAFKKAFLAQTELAAVLVVVVPWIGEPTSEPPHTADFWAGFVFERREIANFLHEHGLTENVLLLHGDAHMLAADNGANTQYAEGANTPGPPLWSAAPLDASLSIKGGPYSEGARTVSKQQYSMLEFDDQGGKIVLTMLGFAVDASNEDQPIESLVLSMTAEFVAAGANPADLNCDGVVDGSDLLILLSAWGKCADPEDCPADLNGDGVVDGGDLLILLSNWG